MGRHFHTQPLTQSPTKPRLGPYVSSIKKLGKLFPQTHSLRDLDIPLHILRVQKQTLKEKDPSPPAAGGKKLTGNAQLQHMRPWGDCGWGSLACLADAGVLWPAFPSPEPLWERSPCPALPRGLSEAIPPAEGLVWGPRGDVQRWHLSEPGGRGGRAPSAPRPGRETGRARPHGPRVPPPRGWERAAGGLSPRPQPGCGALRFPGEGGREGGERQRIPSISPQGRAAGLTRGIRSVLGLATGKPSARGEASWWRGASLPSPPSEEREPERGLRPARLPRRGRVRGGRPGHAREDGGTGLEIKTNPKRQQLSETTDLESRAEN